MKIDLHDLSYLLGGTERQRSAHAAIEALGVWRDLAEYTPALAGTVPLDVDVEGSDLDVICRARSLTEFEDRVKGLYGHLAGFVMSRVVVREVDSVVASFAFGGWGFELFAQDVPVPEQMACVHLLVEERLLERGGEAAREAIRELKRRGMKTEPAFARHLGIEGDPYEELARLR